jgi:hypothetical protein
MKINRSELLKNKLALIVKQVQIKNGSQTVHFPL